MGCNGSASGSTACCSDCRNDGSGALVGRPVFFRRKTWLPGGATAATYESRAFECSGADTLVAFLQTHLARGSGPTLDVMFQGSNDLEEWTSLGTMTQATTGNDNERKQFQNLRGWRFLRASVQIAASSGDADFVVTLTGELSVTNAPGT